MAYNPDYVNCTICGLMLGGHGQWLGKVLALAGPHWPDRQQTPRSLKVKDEEVIRYDAQAAWTPAKYYLLPDRNEVALQSEYDADRRPDDPDHVTTAKMYIGIHAACEDIAKRVMKTSPNAQIRSIGDLWLSLERRCARYTSENPTRDRNFVPPIPKSQPGEPLSLGMDRYYVPYACIVQYGDEWEGWWDEDPIDIEDFTPDLIEDLEPINDASSRLPSELTQFQSRIEALPQEVKDHLCTFFQDGQFSLDCNYLMPQSMWKQIFFQIPFLWDLDTKAVHDKTGSGESEISRWNWEKITRQVMSPAHPSPPEAYESKDEGVWDHEEVGLEVVPDGFTNRRRIWQILEEMYPNDVQW
ncbi:hypothetical protein ACHAPJ_006665 [Fusarium lateritium]